MTENTELVEAVARALAKLRFGDAGLWELVIDNAQVTIPVAQAPLLARIAELEAALWKAATRLQVCAGMIEQSFSASGILRAERTIKAKHFALEALNALRSTQ